MDDVERIIAEAILLSKRPTGMPNRGENYPLRKPYPRTLNDLEWEWERATYLRQAQIIVQQLKNNKYNIVKGR